jgi:hypothetical protein
MLGLFVSPFFASTFVLSLVGFSVWVYIIGTKLTRSIFRWLYSVETHSVILQVKSFYLTPTVFMVFGSLLLMTYFIYLGYALKTIDKTKVTAGRKSVILIYLFIYLLMYPLVFLQSIYRVLIGKFQW